MSVLVIAEHDNAALRPATACTITAAKCLDDDVQVLVAGSGCGVVSEAAARIAGVTKVWLADEGRFAHPLAEPLAALIADLAGDHTHVLAPATTFGKNVLPRAAALRDVAPISDVVAIEADDVFVRPIYAGNALATVRSTDALRMLTVRSTAFDAAPAEGGRATVASVAARGESEEGAVYLGQTLTETERPDLTSAPVVIAGGRGMGSAESFRMLESLADRLGGAVGASRAAVDAGYVPNDLQIGQTGKVVAPALYVAVGISGAIQHIAGMRDSKVIVAINKDEEAPIFAVADYGLVGDLFELLPALESELDRALSPVSPLV